MGAPSHEGSGGSGGAPSCVCSQRAAAWARRDTREAAAAAALRGARAPTGAAAWARRAAGSAAAAFKFSMLVMCAGA